MLNMHMDTRAQFWPHFIFWGAFWAILGLGQKVPFFRKSNLKKIFHIFKSKFGISNYMFNRPGVAGAVLLTAS